MNRNYVSLFLLPAIAIGLYAQSSAVRGTVVDPDGRPIAGARIQCAGRSVSAGPDGQFSVEGVSSCRALVSAEAFQTRIVELAEGAETRVELAVAGLTEHVVVTATRHAATAEEAGSATSVLVEEDLARRGFPAVAEALRELPGMQTTTTGRQGSQTSVYVRGASRTGVLVLVDGVPLNDPGGEFNFGNLTSGGIERIEVVRGPESTLFGAQAAAGVVQLFTKRGSAENRRPRGGVSFEGGNFGSSTWRTDLSGGSGRLLDYALHTSQTRTAGEFPNDAFRNTTGSANLGLRLAPSTQLRGVVRVSDSVVGVPGQVAYGLIDYDAKETNRDSSVSLQLEDSRSGHYQQQATFAYHRDRDLYTDTQMDGPYPLAALVRDVATPLPRTYLVSMLDASNLPATLAPGTRLVRQDVTLYPLFDPYLSATSRTRLGYQGAWSAASSSVVFGYDYERQGGIVSAADVSRDNHGLFLHAQHTLAGRVFFSGGIRVEHSSAYGRKATPRGAVGVLLTGKHGPLSSTFLRLGAGRGITEPSLIQNFSRESYVVGNPNLVPERTLTYDAGLVQEWFGRRARTEVAVFDNSFRQMIAYIPLPPPVWGTWRNLEASRARGVEASGRVRVSDMLTLNATYTHLWTRVNSSTSPTSPFYGIGQELARRPGHSGSVSISVTPRRWWLQVGAAMVGERQDADFWLGVTRNPGYQNVYASGSYKLTAHLAPFVRAENLLNSRYQEALGYSSLSRTLRGGLRVEW